MAGKYGRLGRSAEVWMATRVRSARQAQLLASQELREAGKTWNEIGQVFRDRYGVNARVALRLAHGWSQREAADRWTERWPEDPKTFKNISYWEQWPARTGYSPSLDVLARLAELYGCRVADLLSDYADHRDVDPIFRARSDLQQLAAAADPVYKRVNGSTVSEGSGVVPTLAALVSRMEEADVHELARQTSAWVTQFDSVVDRRSLLLKLSFALAVAASTSLTTSDGGSEYEPIGKASDLSGVWLSRYTYYSSGRRQELSDVHYVTIRHQDRQLAAASLPHSTGSTLRLELTLDGLTATGAWEEHTSPTGYYRGAVYRGAMQLLVAPSGGQMIGKWLGFGKNFRINNGEWELVRETRSLSRQAVKAYSLKV